MEKRRLGTSNIEASIIGFGTWAAGGRGWGNVQKEEVKKTFVQAVEYGVNFFDTAPIYGRGESERVVGEALKPYRDQIYIATKCGLVWDNNGKMRKHNGKESILREIDESLRRLQTDYVDLYQVHWPDPETPIEETMEALNLILESGKARYVGVSNFSKDLIEQSLKLAPIVSLQSLYNILERKVEKEELPFVNEQEMGFIPYSPLAQGLLTGKFDASHQIDEKDVRAMNPLFQLENLPRNVALVGQLKEIAKEYNRPVSQVAINWLLKKQGVSTVICGAKTVEQLQENVKASEWELANEHVQQIDSLIKEG